MTDQMMEQWFKVRWLGILHFIILFEWFFQCIHNSSLYSLLVKLIGKLEDGKIFVKKGHDEEPLEFKIDEGNNSFVILIWFFLDLSSFPLNKIS